MNVLVIFDSAYGNTEILARAIGKTIADGTSVVSADKVDFSELGSLDLLYRGSPTCSVEGRPVRLHNYSKNIPKMPSDRLKSRHSILDSQRRSRASACAS